MYKILKTELSALFCQIAKSAALYLPVHSGGQTNFMAWEEGCQVDLDTLKTVKSPKDAFFPQSENLYTCHREEKKLQITPERLEDQDFVVFGVRACDARAIQVLDRVFLSKPVDSFYAARRQHGTVVSLACNGPEETCFCKTFGIDCAAPEGDVAAWMGADCLYWEPKTEKGEALTQTLSGLLTLCGTEEVTALQQQAHAIAELLPNFCLPLEGWGGGKTEEKFNSPLWEELYKPCLACGTCTFVCPTCQCYDIKDYDTGKGIQRYRCWDSCMYSDFTMMAHGNNRTSQMQRFRQRFMHKLVYYPANNDGMFSCVGCGRCVEKCPAHLNIVKVIKAFAKEENGQ